jgi:hypothetical protein
LRIVLLGVGLLLAAALSAPGDIYRCVRADGSASFQDRPCAGVEAGRRQDRLAGGDDPRALREWLAQYRHAPAQARAAASPVTQAPLAPLPPLAPSRRPDLPDRKPLDEHQLAICSERFYVCADGDGGRMDNCVAHVARCGAGVSACCPAQTLSCYHDLRAAGSTPAQAVRGALLGADAPSSGCGP